jgi:hypothetical protein
MACADLTLYGTAVHRQYPHFEHNIPILNKEMNS